MPLLILLGNQRNVLFNVAEIFDEMHNSNHTNSVVSPVYHILCYILDIFFLTFRFHVMTNVYRFTVEN